MRLCTYMSDGGPRAAAVRGRQYVDLNRADSSLPARMKELLALGNDALRRAEAAVQRGEAFGPDGVRLLAPVPDPEKIICVGLNYADHAAETGATVGDEPVIFNKFPTALRADGDPIELPKLSSQVDYEAELVAVIGRGGRHIPQQQALAHVAGYACGHDVSARDWQKGKPGGQWLLGKGFDSFAPLGPHLVTADEVGDAGNLRIALRLNGKTMQDSNTQQLIFKIDQLVAYLSGVCTLSPGDLIYTGTPPGVGMARKPPVFLQPGDTVEVEIERIGVLTNPVIAERQG
ncbi:MAG: fumarylacetoacetate hydrolase family protein [Pirellulales bacterium]